MTAVLLTIINRRQYAEPAQRWSAALTTPKSNRRRANFVYQLFMLTIWQINRQPFIGTLKLQSNRPLYSNIVIGTLAVDGWAVKFGTARRGLGGVSPAQAPPHCTKCNTHPSMVSVPTSYYLCGTIIASGARFSKNLKIFLSFS